MASLSGKTRLLRSMRTILQNEAIRSLARELSDHSISTSRHMPSTLLLLGDADHWGLGHSTLSKAFRVLNVSVSVDAFDAALAIKWAPWSEHEIPKSVRVKVR